MSQPIKLWDLGPSPNSKKVRLALGYKGIEYERVSVDPADRSEVLRVSGQPLTPVLQHGETVIFDSSGILRYLEANVKREPRIFSAEAAEMKAIEGWENWAKRELGSIVGTIFGQFFAETRDETQLAWAVGALAEAAAKLESELPAGGFLVGEGLSAADIQAASYLSLSVLSPEQASAHPALEFFGTHLRLAPEREALREWFGRVDRFDR